MENLEIRLSSFKSISEFSDAIKTKFGFDLNYIRKYGRVIPMYDDYHSDYKLYWLYQGKGRAFTLAYRSENDMDFRVSD